MQGAIVMAIALAGLGCQNKSCDDGGAPLSYMSIDGAATNPYPTFTPPSAPSGLYKRIYNDDISDVYPTHWDAIRSTIWSFVLGHDPGMVSAREIEVAVYGDDSGH
jgi:hypothetical protein